MEAVCPGHRLNVHEYERKCGDGSQLQPEPWSCERGRLEGCMMILEKL